MGKKSAVDRTRDPPAAQDRSAAEGGGGGMSWASWKPAACVLLAIVCGPYVMSVYAVPGGSRDDAKPMDDVTRERYREAAKEMFYHSYDNYLRHAFPKVHIRKSTLSHFTFGDFTSYIR